MERAKSSVSALEFTIGDLTVNFLLQTVSAAGIELTLKWYEFKILSYLAYRAYCGSNGVVSRKDLEDHLYRDTPKPRSNTLSVFVMRVRNELKRAMSTSFIDPKTNEGYQLRVGVLE
jgi:DNA-binding response OmpR family regulator